MIMLRLEMLQNKVVSHKMLLFNLLTTSFLWIYNIFLKRHNCLLDILFLWGNSISNKKLAWLKYICFSLLLILLERKVISLCHQYTCTARPACQSVQSDQLYTVGWPTSSCHFDIPKYDNGLFQKWQLVFSV